MGDTPNIRKLADLHRRYTGPVPRHEREAAMAGSAERLKVKLAAADVRFWRHYVHGAIGAVRVASTVERKKVLKQDVRRGWSKYRSAMHALVHARAEAAQSECGNRLFQELWKIAR
jgi:hypothetical protein